MRLRAGSAKVVLVVGVLDVGEELAALADEVAGGGAAGRGWRASRRVDVGHGDHPAAQERGDLVGVDPVVLGLAAVDGLM